MLLFAVLGFALQHLFAWPNALVFGLLFGMIAAPLLGGSGGGACAVPRPPSERPPTA